MLNFLYNGSYHTQTETERLEEAFLEAVFTLNNGFICLNAPCM